MDINKIYIIGAGPAGLSCGYYLSKEGYQVEILEEKNIIGGLARSWPWNGFMLDTGPHIFHTPFPEIKNDWVNIFSDLLIERDFYAGNLRKNKYYDYPINLSQLSEEEEFKKDSDFLKTNKNYGDVAASKTFNEYVENLVGANITNAFFKEYPEKLWGIKTKLMSSEWAPKRIRLTEKKEKFFGDEYTAISKYGTGAIMERIGEKIESYRGRIKTKTCISKIVIEDGLDGKKIKEIITSKNEIINIKNNELVILTIPLTRACKLIGIS